MVDLSVHFIASIDSQGQNTDLKKTPLYSGVSYQNESFPLKLVLFHVLINILLNKKHSKD